MDYKFLDNLGLETLVNKIKSIFATKVALESESERAKDSENIIRSNLNKESITRESKDNELKSSIDKEILDREDAIKSEHDRAVEEETYLYNEIVGEIKRAKIEESKLSGKVIDETNRATLAEATLTNNLNDEINRAGLAETTINNRLTDEINRAGLAEATINNKLTDEINRAVLQEQIIDNKLTDEINRAGLAEATINNKLTDEINRAGLAEATIDNRLTGEVNRASLAETTITNNLTDEINRAKLEESLLKGLLIDEINRADNQEQIINNRLTDEINRSVLEDTTISNNLTDEINRAKLEEAKLSGSLTDEINRASNQEQVIDNRLTDEINRSGLADAQLDSRVKVIEQELPKAGRISDVLVNDVSVVDNKIAYIKSSIQFVGTLPDFGEKDKLYRLGDKIYQWVGVSIDYVDGYKEIGGSDETLRAEFEAHLVANDAHEALFTSKTDITLFEDHKLNKENPHEVTKTQIGLSNVDNTSDLEKPISVAVEEALGDKVNISDIRDNLTSSDTNKPLSAKQGSVLNNDIIVLNAKVDNLPAPLHFKGTVTSLEELPTGASEGDVYQIITESKEDPNYGAMYAWNGTAWVKILATAMDISAYMSTITEINDIINKYK